jgi:hypothetical protein
MFLFSQAFAPLSTRVDSSALDLLSSLVPQTSFLSNPASYHVRCTRGLALHKFQPTRIQKSPELLSSASVSFWKLIMLTSSSCPLSVFRSGSLHHSSPQPEYPTSLWPKASCRPFLSRIHRSHTVSSSSSSRAARAPYEQLVFCPLIFLYPTSFTEFYTHYRNMPKRAC